MNRPPFRLPVLPKRKTPEGDMDFGGLHGIECRLLIPGCVLHEPQAQKVLVRIKF